MRYLCLILVCAEGLTFDNVGQAWMHRAHASRGIYRYLTITAHRFDSLASRCAHAPRSPVCHGNDT